MEKEKNNGEWYRMVQLDVPLLFSAFPFHNPSDLIHSPSVAHLQIYSSFHKCPCGCSAYLTLHLISLWLCTCSEWVNLWAVVDESDRLAQFTFL